MSTENSHILVNKEDEDLLTQYSWSINLGYARAYVRGKGRRGAKRNAYLHHLIAERMGLTGRVDHRNRDRTDNRRENLRSCTQRQNNCNKSMMSNNTSGFIGVSKLGDRFRAYVSMNGKQHHVGYFKTAEEASAARNEMASLLHGEFAV